MINPRNMTFATAAEKWLDSVKLRVKPTSCAQYTVKLEKNILPYFGKTKLKDVTADKLREFKTYLTGEGLTSQYIYDILIQIKMITKYISRAYGCPDPAIDAVFVRPEQEAPTKKIYDEIYCRRLCEVLTEEPNLTKAGILLTLFAGLKIGELCALRWREIDMENGILTISKTLQRISAGENTGLILTDLRSDSGVRKVPLAPFLQEILKQFQTDDDRFFLSGTLTPVEPRTMQYRLRSLLKSEDLPSISFSELRRLFIDRCVNSGVDIVTITDILGNSSVQSTYSSCLKPTMDSKIHAINLIAEEVS